MGQQSTKLEIESEERHRANQSWDKRRQSQFPPNIQTQPTFDSHFTLISPTSELSNPSQFLPKRHHYNEPPAASEAISQSMLQKHHNSSKIVIHNVPPLPPDLQGKNIDRESYETIAYDITRPLLRKKKKKSRRKNRQMKRIKDAFSGCAIISAEHADKMRAARVSTFTSCARKTGDVVQSTTLNCAKSTKEVVAETADIIGITASQACLPVRNDRQEEERKCKLMSAAARNSLCDVNDSDCAVFAFDVHEEVCQPTLNSSQNFLKKNIAEENDNESPLAKLDHNFATAVGLHHEDEYFDRLARPTPSPVPYIPKGQAHQHPQLDVTEKHPPINVSLFSSDSSVEQLETSDLDFARELCQPKWQRMTDYDATPCTKAAKKIANPKIEKDRIPVKDDTENGRQRMSSDKVKSMDTIKITNELGRTQNLNVKGREDSSHKSKTRSIFRSKATIIPSLKSDGISQKKSNDNRVLSVVPTSMQNRDHRHIALSISEEAMLPPPLSERQNNQILSSPASSTSSTGENSRGPLLTNQTLSNAAFLFSPSYASEDASLLHRKKPIRDPAFSISTFAARARLSNVSSRSQPVITIPISKTWETETFDEDDYDYASKSSKHVRFSSSLNDEPFKNQERKSYDTKTPPESVDTALIETKFSDLTDVTEIERNEYERKSDDSSANQALVERLSNELGDLSLRESDTDLIESLDKGDYADKIHDSKNRMRKVSFDAKSFKSSTSTSIRLETEQESQANTAPDASDMISPLSAESMTKSTVSSNSQRSIHWTYKEVDGKMLATPNLRKNQSTIANENVTRSPLARYRAAREMFTGTNKPSGETYEYDIKRKGSSTVTYDTSKSSKASEDDQKITVHNICYEDDPSENQDKSDLSKRKVSFDSSASKPSSSLSFGTTSQRSSLPEATVHGHDLISPLSAVSGMHSTASSHSHGSIHWNYKTVNGKVSATPNLRKKGGVTTSMNATNSPLARYRAAKEMFLNPNEKVIPAKRTPPKKFFHRTPQKTFVASRVTVFSENVENSDKPRSIQGLEAQDSNLMDTFSRSETMRRNMNLVNMDDNLDDPSVNLMLMNDENDNNTSLSIADTDATEDPFAEIIGATSNVEPEIPGALSLGMMSNSNVGFASNTLVRPSDIKRQQKSSTSSGRNSLDKENTVSLNYLYKMPFERSKVNASQIKGKQKTSNLFLSPTNRTPMQAQTWRSVSAATNEESKGFNKASTVKRANRKAFSQVNLNIQ